MNQQYGTKWFTFYTKVRPWLTLVFWPRVLDGLIQYPMAYLRDFWLLLSLLLSIATTVLSFIVRSKSKGDYVEFVQFVKKILLVETIAIAYQQGLNYYLNGHFRIGDAFAVFAGCFLILYFLWYRLNVKYFEKRIMQAPAIVETFSELPACPNCGTELLPGSNFCRKCGATIAQETNNRDTPNA